MMYACELLSHAEVEMKMLKRMDVTWAQRLETEGVRAREGDVAVIPMRGLLEDGGKTTDCAANAQSDSP